MNATQIERAEPPATKSAVVYTCSQELVKVSSLLPSNKQRSLVVHSLVKALGLMQPNFSPTRQLRVVTPQRATYKDLSAYHTRDYLDFVLDPTQAEDLEQSDGLKNSEFGIEDDCPPFKGLSEYVQLVGGATLTAAAALQKDKCHIAISWDGGRHHARKSQASGYCYVADCVLAMLALRRPLIQPQVASDVSLPRRPRIFYLDLDLHFSDAVSEAFSSPGLSHSPQFLTLSIHHTSPGFFPATKKAQLPNIGSPEFDPFTLSIPLLQGAANMTYARVWTIVEQIKDCFSPDYVIVQCGVDALAGDPCATLNWSLGGGAGSLGWCIQNVLNWPCKKLLLGGGGYNSPNSARAWTYLTSLTLETPLDLETEIPDHPCFPLYGPSFTLDVPPGNMPDRNTEAYLESIETTFHNIIPILQSHLHR